MNEREIQPDKISSFVQPAENNIDDESVILTRLELISLVQSAVDARTEHLACEIAVYRDIIDDLEKMIEALAKRVRKLEESNENDAIGSNTLKHLDALYQIMIKNNIRHVDFAQIATLLGISRRHANRLRAALDNDPRFEVVRSKAHKQKLSVRLAKVNTVKPGHVHV